MSNIQASNAPAELPAAAPLSAVVTEPAAPVAAAATSAIAEPVTPVVAKPLVVSRKRVAKAPAKPAAVKADVGRAAAAKPARAATPVVLVPAPGVDKTVSKTAAKTAAKATRSVTPQRQPKGVAKVDVQPVAKLAAKSTAKPAKTPKAAAVVKPAKKHNATTIAAMPPITAAAGKQVRSKEKLVRDSFTMPRADFALIHQLKERGLGFKRVIRKSELLRAGLQALAAMDDARLMALLDRLPALKAGRPRKAG